MGHTTLKQIKGSNLTHSHQSFGHVEGMESKSPSEAPKAPLNARSEDQQYNTKNFICL